MQRLDATDNRPPCPSRERLQAFTLGKLPPEILEEIGTHVGECASCQMALEAMDDVGDELIDFVRRCGRSGDEPSHVRTLTNHLQQLPESFCEAAAPHARSAIAGPEQQAFFDRPIPQSLGQYRLVERISHGGMGMVYRAWHMRLKREVALKLLLPQKLHDRECVSRFCREMEVIGQLDEHPHIVRAFDAGEVDGFHYLAMQYVSGIDLSTLLRCAGRLKPADACEVIRQAALGLDHACEHGIVHRDIKPSNLMLTGAGQVKILDLGLAAMRAHVEAGQLDSDLVVGTADYMAPEQWTGSGAIDTRADVYALGCTLFKLLTGQAPYRDRGRRAQAQMQAHLSDAVPSVRKSCPQVSAELDAVTRRMMAKRPGRRYERPGEVAAALEPLCAGADLPRLVAQYDRGDADTDPAASDVTLVTRATRVAAQRRARRRRLVGLLTASILVVLALGAMWFLVTAQIPHLELLLPQQQEQVRAEYDWRHDQFHVHSECATLLVLGTTQSHDYTLATNLSQRDWHTGVGLFFDHRLLARQDWQLHLCHLVWVKPASTLAPGASHEVCVTALEIRLTPPDICDWRYTTLASVPVQFASNHWTHNIRVQVSDGRLQRVDLDGRMLDELSGIALSADDRHQAAVASGSYGFFKQQGMTEFQGTTFRVGTSLARER